MSETNKEVFNKLKQSLLNLDPVAFCEEYLTLDGAPFRLNGNGYKPFADVYRYIGVKALEKNGKPIVLLKSRQVGGTTLADAIKLYLMGSNQFGVNGKPPIRVFHLFPSLIQAKAHSKTKLNPMIVSAKQAPNQKKGQQKSVIQSMLDQSSSTNDSLEFKQFVGGNYMWIESTGINGDRLRGRTGDVIFYDEVQDTTSEAINNTLKSLSSAKYGPLGDGVQVFFGTPKHYGSDYYKLWQMSTQQIYFLGCINKNCNKHFPLYIPGSDDWEQIWLHTFIVKCPHCDHEQDKRQSVEIGKWMMPEGIDPLKKKFIGFHINQLYMPHITKEYILSQKPENHPNATERSYRNEVLGEFFKGDSSTISREQIIELCGDPGRPFRSRISIGEEKMVIMGIDYGAKTDAEQMANPDKGKSGQSYTTAVILTVKGPNLLNIEYAKKFQRNDIEGKKGIIDQLIRQYSVDLTVGDIGFSHDFSTMMHTAYGDKYIVSRAVSAVNKHVRYRDDVYPKEIQFERNYYIEEMFDLMKAGQVRFPLLSYEKISWLLEHSSSMDIKVSLSKTGEHKINYVKGVGKQNDGFMALLNAYLAYKFLLTNQFKTQNPFIQEQNFNSGDRPLIIGGYAKF